MYIYYLIPLLNELWSNLHQRWERIFYYDEAYDCVVVHSDGNLLNILDILDNFVGNFVLRIINYFFFISLVIYKQSII